MSTVSGMDAEPKRCGWPAGHDDYLAYHDDEWGRPNNSEHGLFEKICLEGFQSGLSWLTILRKRDRFREVFHNFDVDRVANFSEADVERLLTDTGIIRHRGKIEATINNAQRCLELQAAEGSLANWIWSWAVEIPERTNDGEMPAKTERSAALAKDLKSRGWKFFGPTTAYAFMQSEGLTNDHDEDCFAFAPCEQERREQMAGRTLR